MTTVELPTYKPKDFASEQEVRWCPGCGDYAILAAVRKVLADMSAPKENYVFVSGIGCSSRFPYYMGTYGLHSIHGRAPALATGIKSTNPDLQVWIVTGDGDGLSIGGNHLLHVIRRNVDVNILLFNNRIYGLTKGQYSPTSERGKKTKSSPFGSIELPMKPIAFALGAGATFVARCTDVNRGGMNHMPAVLKAAAQHKGTSFVEIYQDCNVFNHAAFFYATEKDEAAEHTVYVEHGKPMVFGKARDKGIRMNGMRPEVVSLEHISESDLLFHNEKELTVSQILAQMTHPEHPEPVGVLRNVQKPTYEGQLTFQIDSTIEKFGGEGTIEDLLYSGDTWTVSE
ncbi:MAG: 2-oxoacid:ferredoxin oxidoreductase subunit beta [Planctomycetes bacterium]|nr:2-oxoacid:ferredoxin oxidoreductase subunit beta [Planctomycetota bacterium]NOG52893.1 2-oxoacid:ferredoxin oxidoreductase subunit beta [Planctomycetota bacterium]